VIRASSPELGKTTANGRFAQADDLAELVGVVASIDSEVKGLREDVRGLSRALPKRKHAESGGVLIAGLSMAQVAEFMRKLDDHPYGLAVMLVALLAAFYMLRRKGDARAPNPAAD
jgi:hypothetical protein